MPSTASTPDHDSPTTESAPVTAPTPKPAGPTTPESVTQQAAPHASENRGTTPGESAPLAEVPSTGVRQVPSSPGRVRPHVVRSVNWVSFIGTGVVLGFLAGGLVHLLGPAAQVGGLAYGFRTSLLFFAAFGMLVGALLGALAGVAADAALQRRERRAAASSSR